jgi:hypothetical protein
MVVGHAAQPVAELAGGMPATVRRKRFPLLPRPTAPSLALATFAPIRLPPPAKTQA